MESPTTCQIPDPADEDWYIDLSDNCVFTSEVQDFTGYDIYYNNTGTVSFINCEIKADSFGWQPGLAMGTADIYFRGGYLNLNT
jgi:hypothetical protein